MTPEGPRRKRKAADAAAAGAAEDEPEDDILRLTENGVKRFMVMVLHKEGGLTLKLACERVGMDTSTFRRIKWGERYAEGKEEGGVVGAAKKMMREQRGGRRGKRMKGTPDTKKLVKEVIEEDGRVSAKEVRRSLKAHYDETKQVDRELPSVRSMQRWLSEVASFRRQNRGPMVRTPWHASWRVEFSEFFLALGHELDEIVKNFLFCDEKKFCLWNNYRCAWEVHGKAKSIRGSNPVKEKDMSYDEYREWAQRTRLFLLPSDKNRGLYPIFAWGAVGHDMKSPLVVLDPGERMTKARYLEILREELRDVVIANSGRGQLHIVMDNDSKHFNPESRAFIKDVLKMKIVGSPRTNRATGQPDRAPGRGGHLYTYDEKEYFPAYSPDINGPIEKVWREIQSRVLARCEEIRSRDDHWRVVEEEWDGLEFEHVDGPSPASTPWLRISAPFWRAWWRRRASTHPT